jgi:hypothetical protein
MDLMEGYVDDLLAHDRNLKFDAKNGIAAWKSLIRLMKSALTWRAFFGAGR